MRRYRIRTSFGEFVNEYNHNNTLDPNYYLEDFYVMDGMDYYTEERALGMIQDVIDYVLNISYPLKVYRGIDTINQQDDFDGISWSTDVRVSEGFGNKIYVGFIPNEKVIDVEQTIRTRVMNPYEYEICVPKSEDVEIKDVYYTKK